ncbi:hypothetical protein ACGFWF_32940 [Streptomyces sp. NPDC048581]|uniref:hypothetical protein n=1 Tax=Streptomyces sp. NPDC048581 TaxID=3365572 RepID=UPI0037232A9B
MGAAPVPPPEPATDRSAPGHHPRRQRGRLAGWEPEGVWLGLLTGLAATALLLLRRYHRALNLRVAEQPAVA